MKQNVIPGWTALGSLIRQIVNKFKEDGRNLVRDYWINKSQVTLSTTKFPCCDAGGSAQAFVLKLNDGGINAEVTYSSKNLAKFIVYVCPFGFDVSDEPLCELNSIYDRLVFKGAGCKIKYQKRIVLGDPFCEVEVNLSNDIDNYWPEK